MAFAAGVLLVIGVLGAFDIAWFHTYRCRLTRRPESRTEAWIHVVRGFVYTLQLVLVPNFRLQGAWYGAFALVFVADVAVAMADVAVEPDSRRSLGGLSRGEYVMHIVLSVLCGIYLHAIATASIPWASLPTGVFYAPAPLPWIVRGALGAMTLGCFGVAIVEALELRGYRVGSALVRALGPRRANPLHVSVRLKTTPEELWTVTQDHRLHPTWDHRFSRIVVLGDRVTTGTEMLYEKAVLGMTVRGHGRYKLHRPLRQSTFEFWSNDPRSLIRRGVGLWLYRPVADGWVELRTSYTYDVRWGLVGRIVDRLAFRPFFQRETERSFRRLAERYFPAASAVLGAAGRKPARFEAA